MGTLDYDKIINGIRKALYGYEVREYMAQSIEWTKTFVTQSVTRIETSEKNAKTSETRAATSADSMGTSVATCTTKAERQAQEEADRKRQEALDKLPETLEALTAAQTDTDSLMVDQEYRLTLLELGLTPEA